MIWNFRTADSIRFGRDCAQDLPQLSRSFGTSAVLVTGSNPNRFSKLIKSVEAADVSLHIISIKHEPDLDWLNTHIAHSRALKPHLVIGLGGGSAIDAAKALAALIPNDENPLRYLEVVGDGAPLDHNPLPLIAVPTTSGTGAEVTKNAVISVPEHRRKVSLRDDRMLPNIALVDPVLTVGAPLHVTAATGLDALTQCVEPYLSSKANPMTDALCREGIARASHALPRLLKGAENYNLREDMSLASVIGGMALANAGLGAVHGLAGVLGGWCGAPHGALCGRLLPGVLSLNNTACAEHGDTGSETRFRDVARWLTGRPDIEGLVATLNDLLDLGQVPRLSAMGLEEADCAEIAEAARLSSSMKGNPVVLNRDELESILRSAL